MSGDADQDYFARELGRCRLMARGWAREAAYWRDEPQAPNFPAMTKIKVSPRKAGWSFEATKAMGATMASINAGFAYALTLLCVSTNSLAQTDLPKEGPVAATAVFHGTSKSIGSGDFMQYTYDAVGGWVADKLGGFEDRVTVRCIGGFRTFKRKIEFEASIAKPPIPQATSRQNYSIQWHRQIRWRQRRLGC